MILKELFIRMLYVFQYIVVGFLLLLTSIAIPNWLGKTSVFFVG